MATPTLEQTRAAGSLITTLPDAEFAARRSKEAGDALVAFMVILAKKLFPNDDEHQISRRVELMLAAYFLKGDLEPRAVRPPDEAKARKAVQKVASLDGPALDRRISEEVGDAVLAFFNALDHKAFVETRDRRAKAVQLMVLSYLLRGDLAA